MENKIIIINEEYIRDKIYYIRGKQVLLDSDLAEIYGYSTKSFNQQVKNNINKFDIDFRFQLTDEETAELSRSKNLTLNKKTTRGSNFKYNPYAFTEEGVYMLMTVLKGDIATIQSKALIRIFKKLKDYVISNNLIEQKFINKLVLDDHSKIELLEKNLKKMEEQRKNKEIYFNGQIYDAYSKIQEIFKKAKKELIIIDSYADNTLLDIIKRLNVNAIIITKQNNLLTKQDLTKYNKQYNNLKVSYSNVFHDRFFLIDKTEVFHCGASINRIGYKTFSINVINDKEYCNSLLERISKYI